MDVRNTVRKLTPTEAVGPKIPKVSADSGGDSFVNPRRDRSSHSMADSRQNLGLFENTELVDRGLHNLDNGDVTDSASYFRKVHRLVARMR